MVNQSRLPFILITLALAFNLAACTANSSARISVPNLAPTPTESAGTNAQEPSSGSDSPATTVSCGTLLPADEFKNLLGTEAVKLDEKSPPGGTSCSWQYTPKDGAQDDSFQVQIDSSPSASQSWEDARKAELANEPSEIVVNSIDGLGDENYTWVSKGGAQRVVYVRKGDRTLILRFPASTLGLFSESQVIDFADRLFNRF
jgi:hypothetical protein